MAVLYWIRWITKFSQSVQFSRSVVSDSLRPHESQHTRPLCPSPSPGVHSNSRPSSQRCHPAISSSVVPFFSCPQSLLASESFPMSQLFAWGGQSVGVSALASFLPKNTQNWSPLEWTGWISLQFKGLWRVFSNTTVEKHQFFGAQLSSQSNSHIHTWPFGLDTCKFHFLWLTLLGMKNLQQESEIATMFYLGQVFFFRDVQIDLYYFCL